MLSFFKRVYRKLNRLISNTIEDVPYDFNLSNPLGDNGERVDILFNKEINFDKLDVYQKNHLKRYEFAKEKIDDGDVCGDFACGTGYGSVILADKAKWVTGADLNKEVVNAISERYQEYRNVTFLNENLLQLNFTHQFDSIVSFETLEHFEEENIIKLLAIFSKALKDNGKFIFSTPYMQEQSEQAMKMGFHLSFYINEGKIAGWLKAAGLELDIVKYQNYDTHNISNYLAKKEFIICVARKRTVSA